MKKLLFLFTLIVGAVALNAQTVEDYMQLIKADLNAERKAIFIENMQFNDDESKAFWPIYDEYRSEHGKLGSERIAIYEEYLENYENLNSEKGDELMTRYFKVNESILKLEKKYFAQIKGALSTQRAVQFFQIEHRINALIQLEIMSALPISQPTE